MPNPPAIADAIAALHHGHYAEASGLFATLLKNDPSNAAVLHHLGWIAGILGDHTLAKTLLTHAVRIHPKNADAHRHLAAFLLALNEPKDALLHAVSAAQNQDTSPVVAELTAKALHALGDHANAQRLLAESHAAEPPEANALIKRIAQAQAHEILPALVPLQQAHPTSFHLTANVAVAHQATGNRAAAAPLFRQALWLLPTSDEVLFRLGSLVAEEGRHSEGASMLRNALSLNPKHNRARVRLGTIQVDLLDSAAAERTFREALLTDPDNSATLRYLASALSNLGRNDEAIAELRKALAISPEDRVTFTQYLSLLNYVPMPSREARFQEIRRFNALFPHVETPPRRVRAPKDRIRIGYVSGDFRNHSAAFFIEPQLEHTDRQRFHLSCYHTRSDKDAFTERMLAYADSARTVTHLSDQQVADQVRADGIDILIDCSTHTAGNRLGVFALKPAHRQITMIGQMQTTGLDTIDYRISDHLLSPPDADPFSSERIIRLERGPMTFRPPIPDAPLKKCPSLRGLPFTFGSANDLLKAGDAVLDVWARILTELPESRFVYFAQPGSTFKRRMEERGILPHRLTEHPRSALPVYFDLLGDIDLALDTFPYNGLTVTLLSCWMGLPCVTIEGDVPPARAGAAVLRRIGAAEFITHSTESYITKALELATNPEPLHEHRHSLREKVRSAWCCNRLFMAEFETFLRAEASI
jgi:predicted O-linked N-acetylglucosamine transferase (SPINDLY family)